MIDVFLLISLFFYSSYILFIIIGLFKHTIIDSTPSTDLPKVSVIIAARNEQENLPALIKDLTKQKYPLDKLEVIIINDRSTDKTSEILKKASKNYYFIKHLNIIEKSSKMTPKKHALNEGILISSGKIIISTDADCRVGKEWVLNMTNNTVKSDGISIGFSKIKADTIFEQYQLIDFLGIITVNTGAAGWGKFWSGTGQNLAYFKKDYEKINGFEPVKNELSGDDMYLVQAITKIKNGFVNIDPKSYVETKALKTLKEFLNQRIRWASNSKKNFNKNTLFFSFLLSSFSINLLILISLILNKNWLYVFFIKSIFEVIVLFLGARLFNTKLDFITFFIWAIFQPIYIPFVAIMGLRNKFIWKP